MCLFDQCTSPCLHAQHFSPASGLFPFVHYCMYIHVVTQIKSLLPGDRPARFKRFYLTVTANNGDLSIWTKNKTLRTDKRGEWMKSFLVPSGANCLKIVVCSAYVQVYNVCMSYSYRQCPCGMHVLHVLSAQVDDGVLVFSSLCTYCTCI